MALPRVHRLRQPIRLAAAVPPVTPRRLLLLARTARTAPQHLPRAQDPDMPPPRAPDPDTPRHLAFTADLDMPRRLAFTADLDMPRRLAFTADLDMPRRLAFTADLDTPRRLAFTADLDTPRRLAFTADPAMRPTAAPFTLPATPQEDMPADITR